MKIKYQFERIFVCIVAAIFSIGLCNGKLNKDLNEGADGLTSANENQDLRQGSSRASKFFNYFSIIKFPNEGCSTPSGEGVCTTPTECKYKRGKSLGTCAQGFGCCCNYTRQCNIGESEYIIRENKTTLKSPSSRQQTCRFVFPKLRDICQLRLDFKEFQIANPEDSGACNNESLTISGSSTLRNDLSVCGNLTGEHMYLTYGDSEKITLSFQSKSVVTNLASYDIKVYQIGCNSRRRVQEHCLQSFQSTEGQVRSFNFQQQQLNNQHYSVCIKPSASTRSINWKPCSGNSFFISGNPDQQTEDATLLRVDNCNNDYIQLYGDNKQCGCDFAEIKNLPKPYLLLVNFDENEGSSQPKSFQAPAEDFLNCTSMSRENFLDCNWTSDEKCICDVVTLLAGDTQNSGFCLEYSTNP